MRLTVRSENDLRVTCNCSCPKRHILAFVRSSRDFIKKRVHELNQQRLRHPTKRYLTGETLLFMGEPLRVQVIWTWMSVIQVGIDKGDFEIKAPISSKEEDRAQAVHNFYRRQAQKHLKARLLYWSQRTGLSPVGLSIRGQKTRWGSCSGSGEISLNWKLLAAPPEVIDYVIVHELAHLKHMNHSPSFWRLVEQWVPNFKKYRSQLRAMEAEITVQFAKGGPSRSGFV